MVVIGVCLRVEEEIGIKLPEGEVPPGGCDDVEACAQGTLAPSRAAWQGIQEQRKGELFHEHGIANGFFGARR